MAGEQRNVIATKSQGSEQGGDRWSEAQGGKEQEEKMSHVVSALEFTIRPDPSTTDDTVHMILL